MCGCGFCNLIKLFCEQYECVQGGKKEIAVALFNLPVREGDEVP